MWSCSTKVDLNAPYKSTTVLYGLLDPSADTQWVKINKTFLGEGNALDFAKVRDSSEYRWEEFDSIYVDAVDELGRTLRNGAGVALYHVKLQEKEVSNKEIAGVFYAPEQTVYFFPTPTPLNSNYYYKITVDFKSRPDVEGMTNVVASEDLLFQTPSANSTGTILMASVNGNSVIYKDDALIKWTHINNVASYDVTLYFHYSDIMLNGDIVSHTIAYNIGKPSIDNLSPGNSVKLNFSGEAFFAYLGNVIKQDPNVLKRQIGFFDGTKTRCFDLSIAAANDELQTFISVNSPATGIIQERPVYSNVSNAIGVFASRATSKLQDIVLVGEGINGVLQTGNLEALVNGVYTSQLNFCDPNPFGSYPCN